MEWNGMEWKQGSLLDHLPAAASALQPCYAAIVVAINWLQLIRKHAMRCVHVLLHAF
jgi:hypothetical protein